MRIHALPPTTKVVRIAAVVAATVLAQLLAAVGWAAPALAADNTWTVTSTADTAGTCAPGACTLRAAIAAANSSSG